MHKPYPIAPKSESKDIYFGNEIDDPYQWLEDNTNSDTKQWIEEQKAYSEEILSALPHRELINQRLNELYRYEKKGTPMIIGGHTFSFRNSGFENQDILYIYNEVNKTWESIFNPNTFSKDGTVAIENLAVSEGGKMLAFTVSPGGSDWKEIWVVEIAARKIIERAVKWVKFSDIAWYGNGFYYCCYPLPETNVLTAVNTNGKIRYHRIGDSQDNDKLIYQDTEHPDWGYNCQISESKQHLYIYATESTSGNALYMVSTDNINTIIKLYDNFTADREVIEEQENNLLILTNDKAPNKNIIALNSKTLVSEVIVPEGDNLIEACYAFEKVLVVITLHNASHLVHLYTKTGKLLTNIELPNIGTVNGFKANKTSNIIYFGFSTFFHPAITYALDLTTQTIEEEEASSNLSYNPDEFITHQEWYKSKDGTRIPIFLTHKRDLDLSSPHPTLLYGYGGFDISLTPTFNPSRIFWLENDGILAIPNLRGGGEFGERWHKAGIKLKKQNVFDDFIAAAEYLIEKKITDSSLLAIHGGSNGGLLIGTVTNQRPELFAVAIPSVGVMDMLRYQNFTIGYYWASDYGTSADSEEMFDYLRGYSPIHNIRETLYPAILITTAEKDDRVVPAHSFKYAATMQTTNKQMVCLLRVEDEAGHGAGKPIFKQINEQTDIIAFAFKHLNFSLSDR